MSVFNDWLDARVEEFSRFDPNVKKAVIAAAFVTAGAAILTANDLASAPLIRALLGCADTGALAGLTAGLYRVGCDRQHNHG